MFINIHLIQVQQRRKVAKMCILFLYFCDNPSPDGYRLIIASNRDEYYFRPTASATFWDSNPNIIAGKTLSGIVGRDVLCFSCIYA